VEVVIVDERHAAGEQRIDGVLVDALKVMFADVVRGVGLAGEDDLDGPFDGVQDAGEPLGS
jgi:hypothetical protein